VVAAIARREVAMAFRRRLVKLLFLGSLVPPLFFAVILIVTIASQQFGAEIGGGGGLDWDPMFRLFQIQGTLVLILALGIGTPLVARDRGEDVLFLYATRPVTPWSYTLGKLAAVTVPAVGLLLLPGVLVAVLLQGIDLEQGWTDAALLLLKVALAAILMGWGYAGLTVGPSAATSKARWALLLSLACFGIPRAVSSAIWPSDPYPLAPGIAVDELLGSLFEHRWDVHGTLAVVSLIGWGGLGALVTAVRVRREMTP
jgi:ABC-type transport system involved in multi-copper enzyme maturation permease subunit